MLLERNYGPWEGAKYSASLLRVQSGFAHGAHLSLSQIQNLKVLYRNKPNLSLHRSLSHVLRPKNRVQQASLQVQVKVLEIGRANDLPKEGRRD